MKKSFDDAKNLLNNSLTNELINQGHYLTGALERSIINSSRIIESKNRTELFGFALEYAQDLENGTKKFGRNHVQELYQYFLLRGLNQIQAMEAAVLTNRRHLKEGSPTEASARFSKTGQRKKFISNAWRESEQKVDSIMDVGMDRFFDEQYNKQKTEII